MAVSANERSKPQRTTDLPEPPTPQSDFNEDDYLAGRISVGFVSSSRRLILSQNSLTRESPRADHRSSRNETHQKLNGSSTSQKAPAKAEVNDKNGFIGDATRARPTVNIKADHTETVQLGQKFPLKPDVGENVHTKHWRNSETFVVNNYIKHAAYVKPVNNESAHIKGTAQLKSHDKGKLDAKVNVHVQPHVVEQVSTIPKVKKEKAYFKDDTKRRVDVEPGQNKTLHVRGTSKDTPPVQIGAREATSPKTNGKGTVQVKDSSDKACAKLDITDGQKPCIKVDYSHTAHDKQTTSDETSLSPSIDKQNDNETEETTDTDKVYNYLFYIGKRIPSKSFSRLCRSVNRQQMPPPPSSSSLSS